MEKCVYDFCLERHSSASAPDRDSGILSDVALLRLLVPSLSESLRQQLPALGQLSFPPKLLRRFLRGCVVSTAQRLVTTPAGVHVAARKKMNRIFARVISGVVMREEVRLQAAAAARIAGKRGSGIIGAAASGDVASVLSYLIAGANCVNARGR